MKKILIFLIVIISISCEKQTDIGKNQFLAKIVDYDLNCSTCILQFPYDSSKVAENMGNTYKYSYQAINLNKNDFQIGQLLKVNIRKAEESELLACITLYPTFDYLNIYVNDYEKYCDFAYNDTIKLKYKSCLNDYSNHTTFCFDSVLTDSRCPENLICIWGGEAIVRFKIVNDRNSLLFIDLPTGTIDTIVSDYKISFIDLYPYPNTEIQINKNDYTAKLIIKRK
jgi:hypothetical protein